MTKNEELKDLLVEEYSQIIDPPLVLSILYDFDLCDKNQLDNVRQILDSVRATVQEDEATGFDPSGASGALLAKGVGENGEGNQSRSASGRSLPQWASQTDDTSLSQEITSLDVDDREYATSDVPSSRDEAPDISYTSQLDVLSDEGKEAALLGIFPILKPYDVRWALKKYHGDASQAIDELMTQSFLEENGSRKKGVEAFSGSDIPPRPHKKKGKRIKKGRSAEEANGVEEQVSLQNKWDSAKEDIKLIATNTGLQMQQVTSLYHNNGGSVKATISALIEAHRAIGLEDDDPMIQINTFELRQEFPQIPVSSMEALIQLTHPSLTNARALAKSLSSSSLPATKIPIQLEFRYNPTNVDLEWSEVTPTKLKSQKGPALDTTAASAIATSYASSRNEAFQQAASYYRKSKSDSLMGGAAAYYSSLGRDFDFLAKQASSAAADAHISTQNSRIELDLHGVDVKNAVRISREKVTGWWHELGENRLAGDTGGGYRIITGVGKHTVGGVGKLGPAVGKMLIREGWKVEVGSGIIVVRGVQPKSKRR